MANQYFKNFPELQYTLSNGKVVTIKDFFRKSSIEQDAVNSVIEYTFYEIQDGERPDVVATKLYGDGNLHWTFFLVNQFENYYEWYKDQETYNNYMNEKYSGQWLNASVTTDIVSSASKFLLGEQVSNGTTTGNVVKVDPTFKRIAVVGGTWLANQTITGIVSGKSFTLQSVVNEIDGTSYYEDVDGIKKNYSDTGFSSVSFSTQEYDDNEEKRKIKVIRPEYIRQVVSEFEKIMMA
tara:strand:- start:227 stop:937 length:711 start_codon:yes stop_codon:yes gene_type:complete